MKAIVVEDSRLARQGLLRMLEPFSDIDVVGDAEHPSEALVLIEELKPDVVFLDIHMPGETGFDLLDKLDFVPKIIFTTAYAEYAYRSFDYNAVDYLLKPISQERLSEAITKLKNSDTANSVNEGVEEELQPLERNSKIFIKDGDSCHLVTLSDIRYFESCKNYVRVFFEDQNAYIKKPLSSVEQRLPAQNFFKVSRQFIVNLFEIKGIDESVGDGYDITMSDNKVISVSRRNAIELKRRLSF